MKRMFSSSDLHNKPISFSEYNVLDEYPLVRAPPKPPRTFSRVRAEKRAHSVEILDECFDADTTAECMATVVAKSLSGLQISPSSRPSPTDSSCLREWVLRMCLLEKLERTALVALEIEDDGAADVDVDAAGTEWMKYKMAALMEPPQKKRRFCRKFFRNLSPSRLALRERQKEDCRKSRRRKTAGERRPTREQTERRKLNLSVVPHFFVRTFWKDGKKHTEM